jgi:hypothetical protein
LPSWGSQLVSHRATVIAAEGLDRDARYLLEQLPRPSAVPSAERVIA